MKFSLKPLIVPVMMIAALQAAFGQGAWNNCIDPKNTAPFSTDYGVIMVSDELIQSVIGISGTVTYGGQNGPCFVPAVTAPTTGRIAMAGGPTGTIQDTFDDNMAYTMGWPSPGATWDATDISEDGALSLLGSNGTNVAYRGASDRYAYVSMSAGTNLNVVVTLAVLGDGVRVDYAITNSDTASHGVGLWYGAWTALLNAAGTGAGGPIGNKPVYIYAPGYKPITTERRMFSQAYPLGSQFPLPQYVDFVYGQSSAYGLRILTGPSPETSDSNGLNSDATQVDELAIGDATFMLGAPTATTATFPDTMFGSPITVQQPDGQTLTENGAGDVTIDRSPAFIQKYYEQTIAPQGTRDIVCYYKGTWGASNYYKPYSVTVDAPTLMPTSASDPGSLNQPPGGYDIRVWIDNTRGFSSVDKDISMQDVSVTLNLPKGLNLVSGDSATKVIPSITPGGVSISHVDFHVAPDGVAFGNLPYSVTVSPNPGPTKTVTGSITIPTTAKLVLSKGLNLITTPFSFSDSSWTTILGLNSPTDFQAFNWDPTQNGYVPSTSVSKGKGTWIVATNNLGVVPLQGSPTAPDDFGTGGSTLNIQLQPGWNIIADPYEYAVPLGQLVGVSSQNPNQSFDWNDLVNQGFVNGSLAYYDPTSANGYSYIQALTDELQPNVGYWVYVGGEANMTLNFPAVNQEFVPGSSRAAQSVWTQTANNWRLQLTARNSSMVDSQNFIGVVANQAKVTALQTLKPPAAPVKSGVSLAIEGTAFGRSMSLAQALSTSVINKSFTIDVNATDAGPVTVTWPNISTVPRNLKFTIVDTATGITRSMNQTSGYTFTADANTTRQLKVEVSTGGTSIATIGNVLVTRPSRSPNAPFTIAYNLSAAATTSVRILSASGSVIYNVTAGRADQIGTNTVSWNLKDNADRNVAPGVYRVEITADTADGSRVRKIVTVNVIR